MSNPDEYDAQTVINLYEDIKQKFATTLGVNFNTLKDRQIPEHLLMPCLDYIKKHIKKLKGSQYLVGNEIYKRTQMTDWFELMPPPVLKLFKTKYTDICNVVVKVNEDIKENEYNLFAGFPHKAKPIEEFTDKETKLISQYKKHVLEAVCNNDEDQFNHLMKTCACIVRGIRTDIAIVLQGVGGSGKSQFILSMKYAVGEDNFYEANVRDLESGFNIGSKAKLAVFYDEFRAGTNYTEKAVSTNLNSQVTSPVLAYKGCHKDPIVCKNINNVFIACEEGHHVKTNALRRIFSLDCSAIYKKNHKYWTNYVTTFLNKRFGAVLYSYLMSLDVSKFNPRNFPISHKKEVAMMRGMNPVKKFLRETYLYHLDEETNDGRIITDENGNADPNYYMKNERLGGDDNLGLKKTEMYEDFLEWTTHNCYGQSYHLDKTSFHQYVEDAGLYPAQKIGGTVQYRATYSQLLDAATKHEWSCLGIDNKSQSNEIDESDTIDKLKSEIKSLTEELEKAREEIAQLQSKPKKKIILKKRLLAPVTAS